MIYQIVIILVLIVANGVFAMSEIAIVSARKARLQELVKKGNKGAQRALQLSDAPDQFLSTVQVGITLIGIFAGAFGGATLSEDLAVYLSGVPGIGGYAHGIALAIVVGIITYLSLVIGELVPKRIALNNAEAIASTTAPLIHVISKITLPIVKLLSVSTAVLLKLVPTKQNEEPPVTEEELALMLRQGTEAGVFEADETDMVHRLFKLGDKPIELVMTPRSEMVWYNTKDSAEENWKEIIESGHSTFPVCHGNIDEVAGIASVKDLWFQHIEEGEDDIEEALSKALYIPTTLPALKAVEVFRRENTHSALVVDEFGSVRGIVTLMDIVEGIVGDVPDEEEEEPEIIQRKDGSYLVDGSISIEDFKEYFKITAKLPEESLNEYHTLAGFAIAMCNRIPTSGDQFTWKEWSFEIVDMDHSRIDKILVQRGQVK